MGKIRVSKNKESEDCNSKKNDAKKNHTKKTTKFKENKPIKTVCINKKKYIGE